MAITFTVAEKFPPDKHPKKGSIKSTEGYFYGVWKEDLIKLQEGKTYSSEIEAYEASNRKKYHTLIGRTIVRKEPQSDADDEEATPPSAKTLTKTYPRIAKPGAVPGDDNTPERIFVCGGLNAAIHSGQVDIRQPSTVVDAVRCLRDAWRLTFGNPQQAKDINDEIPY